MVVFLALANLGVTLTSPWKVPHASEAPVNLRDRRAYPEYVADRDVAGGRKLVVLISNSQAAYDGLDAKELYPARLQARWRAADLPHRLENWSADGIRIVETELLTRKALARGAAVIVVILGVANIDAPPQATLDYGNTDIDLLVAEPELWRSLRGGVTYARLERDQLASRLAALHVPLVRERIAAQDAAASIIPLELHAPLFGRRLDPPHRGPKVNLLGPEIAAAARPREARPAASPNERIIADRLSVLERLADALAREAGERHTRIVWCWVPVAVERLHPQLHAEGLRFNALATPLLQSKGFVVHDLTTRLPAEAFFDATHLTPMGHVMMSDLVAPIFDDALR